MLEAVNSVLSNAPLVRAQAEQQSNARSLAANPAQAQVVNQAPYISPYIKVDINYDKAVILIRDADTGDTVRQIPSEPALEAARRQIAAQVRGDAVSDRIAPTPQEAKVETQQEAKVEIQVSTPQAQTQTPAASTAAFGAFAKQVASLQTATSGGGTGSTVSLSA